MLPSLSLAWQTSHTGCRHGRCHLNHLAHLFARNTSDRFPPYLSRVLRHRVSNPDFDIAAVSLNLPRLRGRFSIGNGVSNRGYGSVFFLDLVLDGIGRVGSRSPR